MKQPEIQEHYDPSKALIDESQLRGGKITLADTTARDNWPLDKRKIGMFVTIGTSTKRYGGADVTNTNWTNANNWYSILDKDYGDTLYKKKSSEFIVEGVAIDENEVEIDVYKITKLYMNGRFAFSCTAYATDTKPEKKVEIEVIPVSASKFKVKEITGGFTGKVTLFITFQEIVWDYEGVITVGYLSPNTGYSTGPNVYGSILPSYPYTETDIYSGYKRFNWNNSYPQKIGVSGNIFAVEINGVIYSDVSSYVAPLNMTTINCSTNPFPSVGSTCIVKVKLQKP